MAPSAPSALKCESLRNPLGIDVPRPRFSWLLESPERGETQTACRILVCSEVDLCRSEIGDQWDSDRLETDRNFHIAYDGEPLTSCRRYWWKVRWWNSKGEESPWSEPAFFETGFLERSEWKAVWIGMRTPREFRSKGNVLLGEVGGEHVQAYAVYLRKEFEVREPILRTSAFVCGLGYGELYVNGKKAGDSVLDPAWTDYHRNALYSTYDITDLLKDRTALGIILGNGRHIRDYGHDVPRAACRIEIEYKSGAREIVQTDGSWKASHGPILENGIYYGERYDARLEAAGWSEPGFDDSSWEKASFLQGPPLSSQMMPPIRICEMIEPVKVMSPKPGVYVFDFGQNFTGWARLSVRGPRGTEVRLRYAELLNEDGTLNTLPNENADSEDVYVLKGGDVETYEPRFTYHGFRYVELTGIPGEPGIDTLQGRFVHSDVSRTGSFRSSNDLINRVHQNILWGQLSNLMSIPTDCPQRDERHGWLGDAHLSAEEAILNFDMAAFYTKYLEDIRFAQKEDGSLPDVVPAYMPGLYPADPAWSSAYAILVWLMYLYYGDTRVLERHYLPLKRYIEFLGRNAEDHIIRKLGKYGDWCPPGSIVPKKTPVELTSTWYYYHDVNLVAAMAGLLSRTDDEKALRTLADDIREAFNRTFLEEDQYASIRVSKVDTYPNQTSNVLPLYLDMVPPEKKAVVLETLLRSVVKYTDHHVDTGILGTRYLLDVLAENGRADDAYKIATRESYPGWGYMIREGATTLWERWEKLAGPGMNSHNHIMLGSVDAWFYKNIGGIALIEPGWRKVRIAPTPFDGLTSAETSVMTVRGEVRVRWSSEAKRFALEARVPVGVSAEVRLPLLWENAGVLESGRLIWENGCPKTAVEGVACAGHSSRDVSFEILSGTYTFVVCASDNSPSMVPHKI